MFERKPPSPQGAFGVQIPIAGRNLCGGIDGCVGCHRRGRWAEKVREIVYDNLGWEEDEYFIPEEEVPLLPGEGDMIGDINERVLRSRRIRMGDTVEEWWPRVLSRLPGCGDDETVVEAVDETVVEAAKPNVK